MNVCVGLFDEDELTGNQHLSLTAVSLSGRSSSSSLRLSLFLPLFLPPLSLSLFSISLSLFLSLPSLSPLRIAPALKLTAKHASTICQALRVLDNSTHSPIVYTS